MIIQIDIFLINGTRSPWATLLTWEPHLCMIRLDHMQCWLKEKKRYYLFFENCMVHITQGRFVLSFILEKMIFKVCQYISLCRYYLLLEKAWPFLWRNMISPKGALCQVWLKLALLFFKVRQCIFAISFLSPLENGRGPSLE